MNEIFWTRQITITSLLIKYANQLHNTFQNTVIVWTKIDPAINNSEKICILLELFQMTKPSVKSLYYMLISLQMKWVIFQMTNIPNCLWIVTQSWRFIHRTQTWRLVIIELISLQNHHRFVAIHNFPVEIIECSSWER